MHPHAAPVATDSLLAGGAFRLARGTRVCREPVAQAHLLDDVALARPAAAAGGARVVHVVKIDRVRALHGQLVAPHMHPARACFTLEHLLGHRRRVRLRFHVQPLAQRAILV